MTDTSDDNVTRATLSDLRAKFRPFLIWITAIPGATRSFVRKVEVAHASRRTRAAFCAAEMQDTATDPTDATGIGSWQPDLPFFMQSGFGRE